jgi:hypothetical protein
VAARWAPRGDADAGDDDRAAPRKTLAKKDGKDIYTKLQAELDANATRREFNEWGEANVERIRLARHAPPSLP